MEYWYETEIQMRREDAHRAADRFRTIRLAESGRSTSVRARIADGAQALSEVFASLARTMRASESA